jgi:hypothetical protein
MSASTSPANLHAPNVAGLLPEPAVTALIDRAVKMPASDLFFSINDKDADSQMGRRPARHDPQRAQRTDRDAQLKVARGETNAEEVLRTIPSEQLGLDD